MTTQGASGIVSTQGASKDVSSIQESSYRVSTITCNASIGVCVNLAEVLKHLNISDSSASQNTKTSDMSLDGLNMAEQIEVYIIKNAKKMHQKRKNALIIKQQSL